MQVTDKTITGSKGTVHLIVGLDPGTNIGLAMFDIESNLVYLGTIKNGGKEKVVAKILEFGTPCVVATDVALPPEFVINIASYFNAKLFAPSKDIAEAEKNSLTKEFTKYNNHERDALVAALKFFNENNNKFRWLARVLKEQELVSLSSEVKAYLFRGVPVASAIKALKPVEQTFPVIGEEQKAVTGGAKDRSDEIRALLESNARLSSRLSIINAEKRLLEKRVRELESETYRRILGDKLIRSRELEIRRLKALLKRSKEKNKQGFKSIDKKVELGGEASDLERIIDEYQQKRSNFSVG